MGGQEEAEAWSGEEDGGDGDEGREDHQTSVDERGRQGCLVEEDCRGDIGDRLRLCETHPCVDW